MIAITETGAALENADRGRRERPYDDDHFVVIEVFDRTVSAEAWRSPDDAQPDLGEIPMEAGELWPPDAIAEEKPDEQHYQEATGNEGAEFQRTYRRAAFVVWPAHGRLAVLAQASPARSVALLEIERDRAEALDLAGRILDRWHLLDRTTSWRWEREYVDSDAVHRRMLACLVRLGAPERIERFLTVAARRFFGSSHGIDPVPALALLPPGRAAIVVSQALADEPLRVGLPFLGRLEDQERPEVAAAAAEALADVALRNRTTPAELEELFRAFWRVGAEAAVDRFVARELAARSVARLLPAALSLAGDPGHRAGWSRLRRAIVAHVVREAGPPPRAPASLASPRSWPCNCAPCVQLRAFLASPTEATWSLKAAEPTRRHVEEMVMLYQLDVDRSTVRTTPRTLVCTKHARRHELAAQRHARAREIVALLSDPERGA